MRDVIIIGYGPAGVSAAIYLKRAGIDPLVIGKDLGALDGYDDRIENFYGVGEPISGVDLIKRGIQQAQSLDIEILTDAVISLKSQDNVFLVSTANQSIEAKSVLLATGKKRQTLDIPGFNKYRGKGISMCATCDGYFYRKKKIAVVGCGPYMQHELEYLNRIATDVTVFTDGNVLQKPVSNPVINDKILKFVGSDRITHIETDHGLYPVDGVFMALGVPSSVEFASQLGVIVDKNNLVVDERYQTNVDGLFAAGDIIGGKLQIAKAVFDGMNAAESIYKYITKK